MLILILLKIQLSAYKKNEENFSLVELKGKNLFL